MFILATTPFHGKYDQCRGKQLKPQTSKLLYKTWQKLLRYKRIQGRYLPFERDSKVLMRVV